MSSGKDSLPTAFRTAQERDLKPLTEESAETLEFDSRQSAAMAAHLQDAWFFGIRMGYKVMVETKMGQTDATPVILSMQEEFQDLMEDLGDALKTTVGRTVKAWDYLGSAWMAGTRFWEVEVAARLIEAHSGSLDEALRQLGDELG